jgi:hypothetical protein
MTGIIIGGVSGMTVGTPTISIIGESTFAPVIIDYQNISAGWLLTNYPANISISGITFYRMSLIGLLINSTTPVNSTRFIQVTNCNFDLNYYSDIEPNIGYSEGLDISVDSATNILVENCTFTRNNQSLNWSYGPLLLKSGNIVVKNCTFLDNSARTGPLTILNTDNFLPTLKVQISDCVFKRNFGIQSAAVYSRKIRNTESISLSNLIIEDNESILNILVLSEGPQTLQGATIINNYAQSGAVLVESSATGSNRPRIGILNSVIKNNTADNTAAGVECHNVILDLTGTTITGNALNGSLDETSQMFCNNCGNCGPAVTGDNLGMILGLAIGIPVALIMIVVIILGVVYYNKTE